MSNPHQTRSRSQQQPTDTATQPRTPPAPTSQPSLEELRDQIAQAEEALARRELEARLDALTNPRTQPAETTDTALGAIQTLRLQPPRADARIKAFAGTSTQEYYTFVNRLESHFEQHPQWYAFAPNKVTSAATYLSDDRHNQWRAHLQSFSERPTWQDFTEFCLRLVNNPKNIYREATLAYMRQTQKHNQSVRAFATKLDTIHRQLQYPYEDEHRKEHLWAKVLDVIRTEAVKYPNEPESYEAYIGHLHMVENQLLERRKLLRTQTEVVRSDQETNTPLRSRIARDLKAYSHQKDHKKRSVSDSNQEPRYSASKRKFTQPPTQSGAISCYRCGKPGHYASGCDQLNPRASQDKTRPTKN
jgi:hypothetical protein